MKATAIAYAYDLFWQAPEDGEDWSHIGRFSGVDGALQAAFEDSAPDAGAEGLRGPLTRWDVQAFELKGGSLWFTVQHVDGSDLAYRIERVAA